MATGMNFVASAANTKVVTFIQPVDMNADGEQALVRQAVWVSLDFKDLSEEQLLK